MKSVDVLVQKSFEMSYTEAASILRDAVEKLTGIRFEDVHIHTTAKDKILFISNERTKI